MKTKILWIACASLLAFSGCNSKKSKEYQEAQVEIETLRAKLSEQEKEMNLIFDAVNEIEENLVAVTSKYQKIERLKKGNVENSKDVKADINNQITEINQLLETNSNRINSLVSRLNKSGSQLKEANTFVSRLEQRIDEQNSQINDLMKELENRKIIIGNLSQNVIALEKSNINKEEVIAQKTQEINTAYYAIGAEKDLMSNNVIDKKGRKKVISSDADLSSFMKIDISKNNILPINAKKAELVSQHPENSYEFIIVDKNIESIKITNINEFWKLTRYLIIKTK